MPTSSSESLGTQQENSRETTLSTAKKTAKPKATTKTPKAEAVETEVVTPEAAADALKDVRQAIEQAVPYEEILADGRVRIDAIDDQLLELIVRRMEVAGTLLKAKHVRQINGRDKVRQGAIIDRLNSNVADLTNNNRVTLNQHQIRELFELFIRLGVESFRQNIIDRR